MTNQIAKKEEAPKFATLNEMIQSNAFKNAVAQALPKHMTPDRFMRVALTAMMKNPKLRQCSQASMFQAMLNLSSLGLEPDGRRAHLIPYGNEVQLIIDYKGLIELAKRSGEVTHWRAEVVCDGEDFEWNNGQVTKHVVDWFKPRGKVLAVYSHVKNKEGYDDYEMMTLDDVENIKKRSKAKNSGPWVTDFNEMAKKTVMRRHSKRLTLSPEFVMAQEVDDDKIEFDDLPSFISEEIDPVRMSESVESESKSEEVKQNVASNS